MMGNFGLKVGSKRKSSEKIIVQDGDNILYMAFGGGRIYFTPTWGEGANVISFGFIKLILLAWANKKYNGTARIGKGVTFFGGKGK